MIYKKWEDVCRYEMFEKRKTTNKKLKRDLK